MKESDFIFYRDKENNICSGGYVLNNIFLEQHALNSGLSGLEEQNGDELVIPAGLVLLQQFTSGKIPDPVHKPLQEGGGLYTKLEKIVRNGKRSKKKTRRQRIKRRRRTRKK